MHLLLTNDDGVDAAGLGLLARVAADLPGVESVTVLAPDTQHSHGSHRITTGRDVTLREHRSDSNGGGDLPCAGVGRVFSLGGTPADCARVGLVHLGPAVLGRRFDWVLAGVNHGANAGSDVWVSGTCAAAREATLLGTPAVATSRFRRGPEKPWSDSAAPLAAALGPVLAEPPGAGAFWSVNLPDPADAAGRDPAPRRCPPDRHPLPVGYAVTPGADETTLRYRADYPNRPREPGTDVDVCFGGGVAVSRVELWVAP